MFFYFFLGIIFQSCLAKDIRIYSESTVPHQFPHHVAIFVRIFDNLPARFFCGGSIISNEWILTAAQCALQHTTLIVKAGKHHIDIDESYQQNRRVIQSILHKDYEKPSFLTQFIPKNDIALLKLESPLVFNNYVKAIALPHHNNLNPGSYHFSGWDLFPLRTILEASHELQSVKLEILDNDSCARKINSKSSIDDFAKIDINDNQMCTSYSSENTGPCYFDQGSALIKYTDSDKVNKTAEIIGLFSWSELPCGKLRLPAIYTRVSSYIDWIHKTINNYELM